MKKLLGLLFLFMISGCTQQISPVGSVELASPEVLPSNAETNYGVNLLTKDLDPNSKIYIDDVEIPSSDVQYYSLRSEQEWESYVFNYSGFVDRIPAPIKSKVNQAFTVNVPPGKIGAINVKFVSPSGEVVQNNNLIKRIDSGFTKPSELDIKIEEWSHDKDTQRSSHVFEGDFNMDGYPDVAVAQIAYQPNKFSKVRVTIFNHTQATRAQVESGTAKFLTLDKTFEYQFKAPTQCGDYRFLSKDINSDGKPDFLFLDICRSNNDNPHQGVTLLSANNSYAWGQEITTAKGNVYPGIVNMVNVTGDDNLDLIIQQPIDQHNTEILFIPGDGKGNFDSTKASRLRLPEGLNAQYIDVLLPRDATKKNNSNYKDLGVIFWGSRDIHAINYLDGKPQFNGAIFPVDHSWSNPVSFQQSDINKDGFIDTIVGNATQQEYVKIFDGKRSTPTGLDLLHSGNWGLLNNYFNSKPYFSEINGRMNAQEIIISFENKVVGRDPGNALLLVDTINDNLSLSSGQMQTVPVSLQKRASELNYNVDVPLFMDLDKDGKNDIVVLYKNNDSNINSWDLNLSILLNNTK